MASNFYFSEKMGDFGEGTPNNYPSLKLLSRDTDDETLLLDFCYDHVYTQGNQGK